jgi:peroxiredoxin
MKKSTYILIAFLIFLFGSILALHIDSKNYEEEYLVIREQQRAVAKVRSEYYLARKTYYEYKSQENWEFMLEKARKYFSEKVTNKLDYNSISWDIAYYYKKHNDLDALKLALELSKKGIEANPYNGPMHDTYARVLFELGYIKEAVNHQQIAVDYVTSENSESTNIYKERLERYKDYLNIDKVEIGDKYVDAILRQIDNSPVKLSELIKNKTTLLVFWNPTIRTSRQITRELIPIYHKYKDKGLQIIAVSEANRSIKLSRMKQRIDEESLEWLNLIDTNIKGKVWDAYGVIASNNAHFLIDKNGTVISIDSSKEELNSKLETLLNK